MELASQAEDARRAGDEASAKTLFMDAMRLERQAAINIPEALAVTRSVFIQSTASLAIDCGDFGQAEQFIGKSWPATRPKKSAMNSETYTRP